MIERLFTYGSLMPGGQYAHLLAEAGNDWRPATVTGFVDADGWGHSVGYPALILHASGAPIPGMVVTASTLHTLWTRLDEFEGDAYERTLTKVDIGEDGCVAAYVYALHSSLQTTIMAHLVLPR